MVADVTAEGVGAGAREGHGQGGGRLSAVAQKQGLPLVRILIVDISGLGYATWFASAGKEISFMREHVLSVVRSHLVGNKFDRVVIAVDAQGKKFRHSIDDRYKADRETPDQLMLEQLRGIIETLSGDGAHVLVKEGYEADDIAASVVEWAHDCEDVTYVELLADDKDWLQLVFDPDGVNTTPVAQYRPREGRLYDRNAVIEKLGVPPERVRDLLALQGDSSDNIPGVFKVGPKKARDLLNAFGNLQGISEALHHSATRFTPALAANLKESCEGEVSCSECGRMHPLVAGLSQRLVTLAPNALTADECAAILTKKEPVDMTEGQHDEELDGPLEGELEEPEDRPQDDAPLPAPGQTAMVVAPGVDFSLELEPRNWNDAWRLTKAIFNSRLFNGYGNREALLVTIMMGRSLGLDAMTSLRGLNVVKGKAELSAALMQGIILGSGKAKYFSPVESTLERAVYTTHRVGSPKPFTFEYTQEDAKRARLWGQKGNWSDRPKTMLRWRCVSEMGRMIYPDVLLNCYGEGELTDG